MAYLTEDDEGRLHSWRDRWLGAASSPSALLVLLTALGAALIFWLVHEALIDDSYITLTYARTLAEHGEWGMLPGHEANSATSPLNVLLLGGLTAILGDPVVAAGVLFVGTCIALVLGLRGLGHATGLGNRVAAIGGPLLIASPLLASTIGLETMLVVAGMTYLAWACARGNAVMAGVAGGVLLWLRLDTLLIVVALVLATPALWRRLHVAAAWTAAVVTPWLVFSWFVLGSAVPDTLVIKSGNGWGDYLTGLVGHYGQPYTWAVGGILIIGGVGLISTATWLWWRRYTEGGSLIAPALTVAGAAYFGVIWALDVPPFFWYYAPTLAALTLAAALGLAAVSVPTVARPVRVAAVALGVGLFAVTAIPWWHGMTTKMPLRETPVRGNWAMPSEYERLGRDVGELVGDAPVRTAGEVGAIAYFCECVIVDKFTDRGRLVERIEEARKDSWFYRLNYLMLDTDELEPIKPEYWLDWRRGPAPGAGPGAGIGTGGWNTTGVEGTSRRNGHYELLPHRPSREDTAEHRRPTSDRADPHGYRSRPKEARPATEDRPA